MTDAGMATVLLAESIQQALQWKAEHGEKARFAGGGTDLLLQTRSGRLKPEVLIGLPPVAAEVEEEGGVLVLPALATLADLAAHPSLRSQVPVLVEAMNQIGSPQIRNVATLAGNLCNASPAADSAPVLLVYEASVVLAGAGRRRELPLDRFFIGPGRTALAPDEMLLQVRLPLPSAGERALFRKFGPRGANVISAASFSARLHLSEGTVAGARLAAGSVGPRPLRLRDTEKALEGLRVSELTAMVEEFAVRRTPAGNGAGATRESLQAAVRRDISPISDVRGSAWYKGEVIERCLCWLFGRLGGESR